MTRSQEIKDSSSLRQRNAKYFFGTLLNTYKFHAQLIYLDIYQQKHIIDHVMINHLTDFLNKSMVAFKRLPPENIVICETENTTAFGFDIFCVRNDEFLGDYPFHNADS